MLPLICVYRDKQEIEPFINAFALEHKTLPTHIFRIIPEKRLLHIDQLKALISQISISSPQKRLFVIVDLELSGLPAQNSLLKTLEEKKEDDNFLLFVNQLELVVTTIRSRCHIEFLGEQTKVGLAPEVQELTKLIVEDRSIVALSHPLVMGISQEKGLVLLNDLIVGAERFLETNPKSALLFLKEAHKVKGLLQSNNLNPQLAVDSLLLKMVAR